MFKIRTGPQKEQQLWHTESIFNIKSACEVGPSGEPRRISSSFLGVLFPGQSFWKNTKVVDRRFSVLSPKKLAFLGFNYESQRFSAH